jgi:small-conductance mechanosensitive channel
MAVAIVCCAPDTSPDTGMPFQLMPIALQVANRMVTPLAMILTVVPREPKLLNPDMATHMQSRLTGYYQLFDSWIRDNALELLVAVGIGFALYLLLSWVKRWAAGRAAKRGDDGSILTIGLRAISRTKRFFRIMLSAEMVNGFANAPEPVARTIFFLFTIAAVVQIAIWLREIILGAIERRAYQDGAEHDTLQSAMTLIKVGVTFVLFAIAAIVILDNLGVNVTGLIAGLGVGGIAIGLAAQGIFSDLFAAISIIFDRPFKRGDTITYDTTTARVEKIGMKSTRLRALSGEEKIISNSKLLDKEITNNTQTVYRRVTFNLSIVQHTPPTLAIQIPAILKDIVEAHHAEFIRSGFATFAPSSFDFILVFDVQSEDLNDMVAARHAIGLAIMERFRSEGIEFAYPTQTTYTAAPDGTLVMPYLTPAPTDSAAEPRTRSK